MQVPPTTQTTSNPQSVAPMGSPFRHRAFTVMWIATVVANIGAEQLRNGIADASTFAVFSERWIPHGTCAKLPPTDAKVSADTILQ
jgi:hypothetical protein